MYSKYIQFYKQSLLHPVTLNRLQSQFYLLILKGNFNQQITVWESGASVNKLFMYLAKNFCLTTLYYFSKRTIIFEKSLKF